MTYEQILKEEQERIDKIIKEELKITKRRRESYPHEGIDTNVSI